MRRNETARTWRAVDWVMVATIALLVIDAGTWLLIAVNGAWFVPTGGDYVAYHDGALRWLGGGGFYHPYQLAGSYGTAQAQEALLYPPTILPLLLLPAPLYWAIPIGIVAWVVWRSPRRPLALSLALWPQTWGMVIVGNPGMWIVAALALATRWPGFATWVLMKPSLFPFALYGIHRRGWWVGLAAFCLVSLAFLPLWLDWITVVRNVRGDALYSLSNGAPMLIPLVGRRLSPSWIVNWRRRLHRRQIATRITLPPAPRSGS